MTFLSYSLTHTNTPHLLRRAGLLTHRLIHRIHRRMQHLLHPLRFLWGWRALHIWLVLHMWSGASKKSEERGRGKREWDKRKILN